MFKIAEKKAGISWEIAAVHLFNAKKFLEVPAVEEKLGSPLTLEMEYRPLTDHPASPDEKMYSVVVYCEKQLGGKATEAIQSALDAV